jgi:hypothetical protein
MIKSNPEESKSKSSNNLICFTFKYIDTQRSKINSIFSHIIRLISASDTFLGKVIKKMYKNKMRK